MSGLHGHPSTPNPRPKKRVETPGDPWGVPQPPGPSSPAYGTPPTANRWFLPLSSSQSGQTLLTMSVMFRVRIEPGATLKARRKSRGVLRKCKYEYDKKKTNRFINAKFKNAELYWNLLKSSAGVKSANIPLSSFE